MHPDMSAVTPKADMPERHRHVRLVPIPEVEPLTEP